jgi:hypothetical protein
MIQTFRCPTRTIRSRSQFWLSKLGFTATLGFCEYVYKIHVGDRQIIRMLTSRYLAMARASAGYGRIYLGLLPTKRASLDRKRLP